MSPSMCCFTFLFCILFQIGQLTLSTPARAQEILGSGHTAPADRFRFSDFDKSLTYASLGLGLAGLAGFLAPERSSPVFAREDVNSFDRALWEHYETDEEPVSTFGSPSSLAIFPWMASGFVYYTFWEENPDKWRKNYLLAQSLALNMGLQQIASKITGRERPDGTDYESFYSGHAANAFDVAAFMAADIYTRNAGPRKYLAVLPYLAAAALSYTRIVENKHFATDVLAGMAVGTITGNLFYRTHYDRHGRFRKNRRPKLRPNLAAAPGSLMLSLDVDF